MIGEIWRKCWAHMKWASLQKLGSLRRKHCHTETMSASVNFKPCRWKSTGGTVQCFDIRLCPLPWTQRRLLSPHSPTSIMMDGKWHWRNVWRVGAPWCPTAATPGLFSWRLLTLALRHHNLSTLLWQIEKLPWGRKWGVSGLRRRPRWRWKGAGAYGMGFRRNTLDQGLDTETFEL